MSVVLEAEALDWYEAAYRKITEDDVILGEEGGIITG